MRKMLFDNGRLSKIQEDQLIAYRRYVKNLYRSGGSPWVGKIDIVWFYRTQSAFSKAEFISLTAPPAQEGTGLLKKTILFVSFVFLPVSFIAGRSLPEFPIIPRIVG